MISKAGEMFISWYSGMQCCSLKYLILVKSEIGSRKMDIFIENSLGLSCGCFMCVCVCVCVCFNKISLFSMLQIIIDCS